MPLDAEAIGRGCTAKRTQANQLCGLDLDRFKEALAEGAPITVACTQEEALFREVAENSPEAAKKEEKPEEKKDEKTPPPADVAIDFERFEQRSVVLPPKSGNYADLQAVKDLARQRPRIVANVVKNWVARDE